MKGASRLAKVLLVCSAGGHLLELHRLQEEVWSNFDRVWVTLRKIDSEAVLKGEKVYYAFGPTNRHYANLIKNLFYSLYVLIKERPTCVVSSGAGIAIPFLYCGRLLGARTIYLESFARWSDLSLTGRLVYPVVHDFVVQSPEITVRHPKAVFMGSVF
jgi:UDP-N-acetylglucosamine:LPS N-acetylglucosamine transferase